MLKEATEEQKEIVKLLSNNNVVIQAVAGSGKTTTALHVAKNFKDKKILLLTFNKKLQQETENKVKEEGFKNLTVKTFHAFAGQVYNNICKTTNDIQNNLESDLKVNSVDYDIFIIDEAQDLNIIFYKLLIKIFINHQKNKNFRIIVLGDVNQSIYEFLEADSRFLSQAPNIFNNINDYNWATAQLSTSFRVNNEVATFINEIFYKKKIINSHINVENAIEYNVINQYELKDSIKPKWYEHIKDLITQYGVNETFILTNSPNSKSEKSLNRMLQNALSEEGIPVEVHDRKEEKIDLNLIKNKLIFSSFHSSKGLERKLVIIFPFDASLFYRETNRNKIFSPLNELYVACTRSLEKLVLLHLYQSPPLPFLEKEKLKNEYLNLEYLNSWHKDKFEEKFLSEEYSFAPKETKFEVTRLLDWLKNDEISYFYSFFDHEKKEKQENPFEISPFVINKSKNGEEYLENVSSITGNAIVSKFEIEEFNAHSKLESLIDLISALNNEIKENKRATWLQNKYGWILKYADEIIDIKNTNNIDAESILRAATLYDSVWEEREWKIRQVKTYDWITNEQYSEINKYLITKLSRKINFEKPLRLIITWEPNQNWELAKIKQNYSSDYILKPNEVEILGRIDAIDLKTKTLWEFKFVDSLKDEHYFQLLTYAYINYANAKNSFERKKIKNMKYKLMNIKNKEIIQIKPNWKRYKEFLYKLIDFKLTGNTIMNDQQFIDKCLQIAKNEALI